MSKDTLIPAINNFLRESGVALDDEHMERHFGESGTSTYFDMSIHAILKSDTAGSIDNDDVATTPENVTSYDFMDHDYPHYGLSTTPVHLPTEEPFSDENRYRCFPMPPVTPSEDDVKDDSPDMCITWPDDVDVGDDQKVPADNVKRNLSIHGLPMPPLRLPMQHNLPQRDILSNMSIPHHSAAPTDRLSFLAEVAMMRKHFDSFVANVAPFNASPGNASSMGFDSNRGVDNTGGASTISAPLNGADFTSGDDPSNASTITAPHGSSFNIFVDGSSNASTAIAPLNGPNSDVSVNNASPHNFNPSRSASRSRDTSMNSSLSAPTLRTKDRVIKILVKEDAQFIVSRNSNLGRIQIDNTEHGVEVRLHRHTSVTVDFQSD